MNNMVIVSPRRKDRGGFTLIEMFLTVSIMVIASGFCVVSYLDRADRARLEGATRSIVSELDLTKMESVASGINTSVTLPVSSLYMQKEADLDGNGSISSDERQLVEIQHAADVTVTTSGAGATFTGSGMFTTPSAPWYITITTARSGSRYVYVFGSGLIEQYDTLLSL